MDEPQKLFFVRQERAADDSIRKLGFSPHGREEFHLEIRQFCASAQSGDWTLASQREPRPFSGPGRDHALDLDLDLDLKKMGSDLKVNFFVVPAPLRILGSGLFLQKISNVAWSKKGCFRRVSGEALFTLYLHIPLFQRRGRKIKKCSFSRQFVLIH